MSSQRVAPTPRDVGAFYDRKGEVLARLMGGNIHYGYFSGPDDDSTFAEAADRLTDHLIELLAAKPGQRVLDLGCGRGQPAVRLAKAVDVEIVGISVSERDVAQANELAAASGVADRVRFQRADAMDLPFPSGSFDVVWALESVLHMPDRRQVLRNVATVLRPGGRLALTDVFGAKPDTDEARAALDAVLAAWSINSLADIEEYPSLLADAGLRLRELVDVSDRTRYSLAKLIELFQESTAATDDSLVAINKPMDSWRGSFAGLVRMGYLLLIADRKADQT